ncbi:hypothetical protein K2X33_00425 [bacterium]|nr:hypothetical protein [bacterium]
MKLWRVFGLVLFAQSAALGAQAVKRPTHRAAVRTPNSEVQTVGNEMRLWLGLGADIGRAVVSYSSGLSAGLGLGADLGFTLPVADVWALEAVASYQRLVLGRALDGSGALSDTASDFTQTLGYVGATAMGLVRLSGEGTPIWLEAGGQYLYPLSASQARSGGSSASFTNTDKLVLALLGVRAYFPLGGALSLQGRAQAFYNLASAGGSAYLGLRLGVAVGWAL